LYTQSSEIDLLPNYTISNNNKYWIMGYIINLFLSRPAMCKGSPLTDQEKYFMVMSVNSSGAASGIL
jgi:hypothetical protein